MENTAESAFTTGFLQHCRDLRLIEDAITGASHPWFALRVRSNFERVSALHLRQRGYEEFLPAYSVRSRWSDRYKAVERLLFPGYVFCRVDPRERLPVLKTPGVVGLVSFGKAPAPIPDHEIEAVQKMLRSELPVVAWPFLQTGQKVLVERGPLAGLEGILTEFKRQYRIVVSIVLLQRSVAAELDADWVRPITTA